MLSICRVIALMAPVAFVSCNFMGDDHFDLSPYGPEEEVAEEPREVLCFEGYVLSAEDNRFVSDVLVYLISDGRTWRECLTGESGYYRIRCAPVSYSRTFILRAQRDGWTSQVIEDVRYRPDVQRFDFVLEPLPEE